MSTTRCKMRCNSITHTVARAQVYEEDGVTPKKDENNAYVTEEFKQPNVQLAPVYSDDPESENRIFWTATPSGSVSLNINNPRGAEVFEVGEEYFVDFTKVEKPVEA